MEAQFPVLGLPKEIGLKAAIFGDAGTVFGYKGKTDFSALVGGGTPPSPCVASTTTQVNCISVRDSHMIRSSVGMSLLWASPLGPIRFDFAKAVTKDQYDRTQFFRFSGGTSF